MKFKSSRRQFLQAGLALPAAGFIAVHHPDVFSQAPSGAAYRTLGKTGLRVSSVGSGVGIAPDPGVIARAIDLGVNYFDTARGYGAGKSEEILGAALKGKRSRVVLATKTDARTKADVFKDMDASLKALGTDYVDIWHLHSRDTPDTITDEAVEACEMLKKQGKTRFMGVSAHDINAVVDTVLKIGKFDVVQTTYSYAIGAPFRSAAISRLHDAGIGVVAMKVIIAVAGFVPREVKLPSEGPLAAVKWVLLNPAISTTVPYTKNIAELEMNVRAMTESYTAQDEKMLFVRNREIRQLYCRMCYECKGQCPKGVPVTDELRFLAYSDFGGNLRQAREYFGRLPQGVKGMRCSDCSSCAIECPNGVDVRTRLIRAQDILA
ncbi:MAG: aldo/keto reductase [Acidobacteria bacterium]|nr:aldo/keto reductase [Acidobacteriota bacterium]MBP1622998.1 aldo/keto reductase [Acidobacteriota bacterium]